MGGESIIGCWSRFTGVETHLHSPHAAASLVFITPTTLCCCPAVKEIEQEAAVPGASHHTECRLSSIHVVGRPPDKDSHLCANWHGQWNVTLHHL